MKSKFFAVNEENRILGVFRQARYVVKRMSLDMKNKIIWMLKNVLFGFLFGAGMFAAITGAEKLKRVNWFERCNYQAYSQESDDLKILEYVPILDQREFKYSFKIKNNTSHTYSKVWVNFNVYKNNFLVAECSSATKDLTAMEVRNVVEGCYTIIPENVNEDYMFEIKVVSYQN